jgi:hypothetical protein
MSVNSRPSRRCVDLRTDQTLAAPVCLSPYAS